MEPIFRPETSVNNYQSTTHNFPIQTRRDEPGLLPMTLWKKCDSICRLFRQGMKLTTSCFAVKKSLSCLKSWRVILQLFISTTRLTHVLNMLPEPECIERHSTVRCVLSVYHSRMRVWYSAGVVCLPSCSRFVFVCLYLFLSWHIMSVNVKKTFRRLVFFLSRIKIS